MEKDGPFFSKLRMAAETEIRTVATSFPTNFLLEQVRNLVPEEVGEKGLKNATIECQDALQPGSKLAYQIRTLVKGGNVGMPSTFTIVKLGRGRGFTFKNARETYDREAAIKCAFRLILYVSESTIVENLYANYEDEERKPFYVMKTDMVMLVPPPCCMTASIETGGATRFRTVNETGGPSRMMIRAKSPRYFILMDVPAVSPIEAVNFYQYLAEQTGVASVTPIPTQPEEDSDDSSSDSDSPWDGPALRDVTY